MSENAQAVGLSEEMLTAPSPPLSSPTNLRYLPTTSFIVGRALGLCCRRLSRSFHECVQITLLISVSSSVPFSASYNPSREPQLVPRPRPGTNQPRAKGEAVQLVTRAKAVRLQTRLESVRSGVTPEAARSRTDSDFVKPGTQPEALQHGTRILDSPPSMSVFLGVYRSQVLMWGCHSTYAYKNMLSLTSYLPEYDKSSIHAADLHAHERSLCNSERSLR